VSARTRRPLAATLIAVLVLMSWRPIEARAATACDPNVYFNMFSGNGQNATGAVGVKATIEWANPVLCAQTGTNDPSWSLSWVSLDGANSPQIAGVNIFQGGFARCANVPSSCPYNGGASYYWYYYGHETGPCGLAFNTGVVKASLGNAGTGSRIYRIERSGSTYGFWISGQLQVSRSADDLDVCWDGGVRAVEWQNEMLDPGDHTGGLVSDAQKWETVAYKNSLGTWVALDRGNTSALPCDANSNPTYWSCLISASPRDVFYQYDRRAP
jgi:hypothetical protein